MPSLIPADVEVRGALVVNGAHLAKVRLRGGDKGVGLSVQATSSQMESFHRESFFHSFRNGLFFASISVMQDWRSAQRTSAKYTVVRLYKSDEQLRSLCKAVQTFDRLTGASKGMIDSDTCVFKLKPSSETGLRLARVSGIWQVGFHNRRDGCRKFGHTLQLHFCTLFAIQT